MEDKYEALKLKNQLCFPVYLCAKEIQRKYAPFLDKLNLIIEKTDPRYRMRFVIADSASAVRSYSICEWYKNRVSANDGIWIGSGLYLQNSIKLNRNRGSTEELENGFGYVVEKGKERLAKFLDFVHEDEEVDYE